MPEKGIANQPFSGWYRNHRGDVQWRIIMPIEVWFGSTEWHKNPQWFLKAYDPQKDGIRDFALCDFLGNYWNEEHIKNMDLSEEFKAMTARTNSLGYQIISNEQIAQKDRKIEELTYALQLPKTP